MIVFGSSEDSYVVQLINSWSVSSKPGQDHSIPPSQYQGNSYAAQGIQMGSVNKPVSTARSDLTNTVVVSPNAQYAYKARALYDCEFVAEIGRTVMRGELLSKRIKRRRRSGNERVMSCVGWTTSENWFYSRMLTQSFPFSFTLRRQRECGRPERAVLRQGRAIGYCRQQGQVVAGEEGRRACWYCSEQLCK